MQNLEEVWLRCMKCGECQAVCPAFSATGREGEAARGKVRLVKALLEGELKPSKALAARLATCLLCKACSDACPSGVKVDQLIIRGREMLVDALGLPLYKKVFFGLLEHPRLVPLSMSCGRFLGLLPEGLPAPGKPFKELALSRGKAGAPEADVVFFAGCMINYVYPGVGIAAVEVLEKMGRRVEVMEERCCGIPTLYAGDSRRACASASDKLENLTGNETIVTACPTCATAWRTYPELVEGELHRKASRLASRTYELSEFLLSSGHEELKRIRAMMTYHQPCHLAHGLGAKHDAKELARLLGEEFVDIEDRCCGFGGLFSYEHPEMARQINDERLRDIAVSGAELVVTPCPGCMYQLQAGIKRKRLDARVVHIAELLSMAMEQGDAE